MLTHADIWAAIDALASSHGLTPSALARKAGLDPTTFNKSKRMTREGKPRWPSTESLSKVLDATGASLRDLLSQVDNVLDTRTIPLLPMDRATLAGYFDHSGRSSGPEWDNIPFPGPVGEDCFALRVGRNWEPVLIEGDILVISPQAPIRHNDRVIVALHHGGGWALGRFVLRTDEQLDLSPLDPCRPPITIASDQIAWIARIVWSS